MHYLPRKFRRSLIKKLINRPNWFINPFDHMGFDILVDGFWDDSLTQSMLKVTGQFGCDLFIDIGANIGAISLQLHDQVNHIVVVEPNPIAYLILRANLMTHIAQHKLTLCEFALGSTNDIATLKIPLGNLGGAYIEHPDNSLSFEELSMKEGGILETVNSYPVTIKNANDFFAAQTAVLQDHSTVLVKIDVEGMEAAILRSLIESSLWNTHRVIAFFECWSTPVIDQLKSLQLTHRLAAKYHGHTSWISVPTDGGNKLLVDYCITNDDAAFESLIHARTD
jgi:FkbM family methyltransferase